VLQELYIVRKTLEARGDLIVGRMDGRSISFQKYKRDIGPGFRDRESILL
jgi:hypothetical protein